MNKIFDYFGYTLLAVFLFGTHAKMFYWLQPSFDSNGNFIPFSWLQVDEKILQAEISGLLFGLMTVYIIVRKKLNPMYRIFVIAIAIFDGLVVFYLNEGDIQPATRMLLASIHYAAYTVFIILMFGYPDRKIAPEDSKLQPKIAARKVKSNARNNLQEIIALKNEGKKGSEIAKILGISESTVSRALKR